MIYNILAWTKGKREDLDEDDTEKLVCDTWQEKEEDAFKELSNISTYSDRGVILDFTTNRIIAELKNDKITKLI